MTPDAGPKTEHTELHRTELEKGISIMLLNPYFGQYGGQFVPELLLPALDQLERAYVDAKDDPAFRTELDRLLTTHEAHGQNPRDRRDGRGPARRRHGARLGPIRLQVQDLHGRQGRRAPEAQRLQDGAHGRRGRARHGGKRHAQGGLQRGPSQLGRILRGHALHARHRRGPASLPDDRA